MKRPERRLTPVINHGYSKKTKTKPAVFKIVQKFQTALSERSDDPPYQQEDSNQAEIQVDFKIAIVSLVSLPPVQFSNLAQPFSQPEAFKTHSDNWIGMEVQELLPDFSPSG